MAAQLRSCVNIVILGEGGTGKSSITLSYLRKGFQEEYDPTVEDSYTTSVPVEGFGQTDVELVDTAGQGEHSVQLNLSSP